MTVVLKLMWVQNYSRKYGMVPLKCNVTLAQNIFFVTCMRVIQTCCWPFQVLKFAIQKLLYASLSVTFLIEIRMLFTCNYVLNVTRSAKINHICANYTYVVRNSTISPVLQEIFSFCKPYKILHEFQHNYVV